MIRLICAVILENSFLPAIRAQSTRSVKAISQIWVLSLPKFYRIRRPAGSSNFTPLLSAKKASESSQWDPVRSEPTIKSGLQVASDQSLTPTMTWEKEQMSLLTQTQIIFRSRMKLGIGSLATCTPTSLTRPWQAF